MRKKWFFYFTVSIISIYACNRGMEKYASFGDQVIVTWELTGLSNGRSTAVLTLENNGTTELRQSDWSLYFNQIGASPGNTEDTTLARFEHINGDFFRLIPGEKFQLGPGKQIRIPYTCNGRIIKESHAPEGLYFVFNEGSQAAAPVAVKHYRVLPFSDLSLLSEQQEEDGFSFPTPQSVYTANSGLSLLPAEKVGRILPTPGYYAAGKGMVELSATDQIRYQAECKEEAMYLSSTLEKLTGVRMDIQEGTKAGNNAIVLQTDPRLLKELGSEGYHLRIAQTDGISITGSDRAGVFYGIQSILALIPADVYKTRNTTFRITEVEVKDAPRFSYRGFHLDVARNFSKKETVLKLLDLLALYKINTLHFHLTDDEGWRIEIPGLPELTEVGSKRGHTLTSEDLLQPAYGSGPFADPVNSSGTGYYSRKDFTEILRYAQARHIQVVPEINAPGHSRAAIRAMEKRYLRFMAENNPDAALEYRLADPLDSSVYSSAQVFNDNVICVALESVYRFYETVISELKSLYDEAGIPLTFIHTGGDEVPRGVWTRSPECRKLLLEHPEIGDPQNLQGYFLGRLVELLRSYNLTIGGWEEVAMLIREDGWKPNPAFLGQKVVPFVWNSIGSNLDLGYKLANAGYPVILCNVNNFYFDLSYNPDPKEPGLYWGGFVDTRKAFEFIPYDVFKSSLWDHMGRPILPETAYAGMERLKPEARGNILGIQAQLWSETIKNGGMLEYSSLPKLLGFAERAWSKAPAYETMEHTASRIGAIDQAWNIFVNQVGHYQLPRLDYIFGGFNYRIAPPGAVIEQGKLHANTDFPGLVIRYTIDGSEPDDTSPVYQEPVAVTGTVKLKTFNGAGRSSRTVEVGM